MMDQQRREKLSDLLFQWEDLYKRGQDTPAQELAPGFPELVGELASRIRALKATQWLDHDIQGAAPEEGEGPEPGPPRVLASRYRLEQLVAMGGYAEVWRAYDLELHRPVAIKIPKATRTAGADSFLAEARRVARLRHAGIVPVHDVGVDGDDCFIVSEFMDGGSLADRLAKGPVEGSQAVRWVSQIADSLHYAHENGVIHRDVKPANILLNHHGDALLADFGIAQSATQTGTCDPSIGTLRYMASEQLDGGNVTPAADVYSLAVVLHELLTGTVPYSSADPNAIRREIASGVAGHVSKALPKPVADICKKALSRSPEQRYASAAEFAGDLRKAVDSVRNRSAPLWAALAGGFGYCCLAAYWFGMPAVGTSELGSAAVHFSSHSGRGAVSAALRFPTVDASLPYVTEMTNIRQYREWQNPPLTYFGPTENDVEGRIVYRFDFSSPPSAVRLIATTSCWDFTREAGGIGRGASAIEASQDGSHWVTVRNGIEPRHWGEGSRIDEPVPTKVIGTKSLWIRIRLLTVGSPNVAYSAAQFGRSERDSKDSVFSVIPTF